MKGPVSGEVVSTEFDGMMREGHDIAALDEHMVVKVPLTRNGIRACKTLSTEGIRVNVTLVFSAAQALLAAKAGATFVSPFVGRLDDVGTTGMDLIRGDRADLTTTTSSRPRFWSPAAAIPFTSSRPPRLAPTSARARRPSSISCSTIR